MMILRDSLFASVLLTAVLASAVSTAPTAYATPDDSPESAGCEYALSSPELVIVPGGGKAVRATLTPTTCAPNAQPTEVTVCVSPRDGRGDCKRTPGWSQAEVLIPAAPSAGVFTATGKGCWQDILGSFTSACRTTGPVSQTF